MLLKPQNNRGTDSKIQQGRKDKGQIPISNFMARNKKFRQKVHFCRKKIACQEQIENLNVNI